MTQKRCFLTFLSVVLLVLSMLTFVSCGQEKESEKPVLSVTELSDCSSLEVYVWPMAANSFRCKILPGTHRVKTFSELMDQTTTGSMSVEETKEVLEESGVADDKITVYAYAAMYSSYAFNADDAYMQKLSDLFDGRYHCERVKTTEACEVPEDFEFSLRWGVYGISSYDSRTHQLIKTNDTDNVRKYTAELVLHDWQRIMVYDWLTQSINLFAYPETYDPFNDPEATIHRVVTPPSEIIVTVTADGVTHTVTCAPLAGMSAENCWCEEAAEFMEAIDAVIKMLTTTPEWESLPEYEHFYD